MLTLSPPIWAMTYLALAAGASWALGWPEMALPHHELVGMVIFFAGWIAPVWAFRMFRVAGTELDPVSESNRVLVTTGPFRLSRNPMYLGLTVATFGMALWAGWWPMLAAPIALFVTANWAHVPYEEAKMRRQFGAEFDTYASRVRRWI